MKNKLLVYPIDPNPYQKLLYFEIEKYFTIKYILPILKPKFLNIFILFLRLIYYRIKGYNLIHIHWLYEFSSPFRYKFLTRIYEVIALALYLVFIMTLKICRYKIIWTVHNLMPHEKIFLDDHFARKMLIRSASAIIIHSKHTLDEFSKYNLPINNIHIIPIGNYSNIYKNKMTRSEARRKLKIGPSEFVILQFGMIRKYKGTEDLLLAFSHLVERDPKYKLILVGKCFDEDLKETILKYKKRLGRKIYVQLNHIDDKNIELYFKAADITAFPFRKITTSSTILLALSFKKPVLYPNIGILKDLPNGIGFKYVNELNGLELAISNAKKRYKDLESMGEKGYIYSQNFSWENISKKTIELYNGLI